MAKKTIAYQNIPTESKKFYPLAALIAAVAGIGLLAAWYMEHNGHWVTGMDNQVVWGLPHVFAVTLIVAASGVLNVASIGSVFGRSMYKPLARLSGLFAIALLIGGLIVLVLDLGRPDRLIVAMTTYNFKSIFAWNILFYSGFVVIVAAYLWVMMERRMNKWSGHVGLLAFVWRLCLTTATGSIFGFLVAREAYDAAVMAPLFISMSFALGLAIFILAIVVCYSGSAAMGSSLRKRLARLLAIFIAALLYFTIVQHLTGLYAAEHSGVERYLLLEGGIISTVFWLVQIVLGTLLPLALLLWPGKAVSTASLSVASGLVIIGAITQVYIIIIGGQSYPLELFPGYQVTSSFYDGVIAHYIPSLPELLLGIGGMAISLIVVMIGLRALPMMPVSLADEVVDPHHHS
jgi:[DsrC]-trisulfide reductase subunit P